MTSVITSLLLALSITPTAAGRLQERPFNPSGYFIPQRSLKNSSNIRWIHLSDYSGSGERIPMYVELRIGSERRWAIFGQASLTIEGYRIRFKTKARGGLSYEFEGQFSPSQREKELGQFEDSPGASAALRGVLHTKRGRRLIISEEITFYYAVGD